MAVCVGAQRAAALSQVDERPAAEAVPVSVVACLRSAWGAGPTARADVTKVDVADREGVPGQLKSTRQPRSAGSCGGRPFRRAIGHQQGVGRGAGVVLVHVSRGGSVRASALQLHLTPAVDVPCCPLSGR